MTTVLLVRHGLTDYVTGGRCAGRTPGVPLSAEGRAQAETVAKRLATLPIKAVYSGMTLREIQVTVAASWSALLRHAKGTRIPGGETMDEIQERIVAEIDAICREHPQDMVVAVSHGDPIKLAIAHYIGLDLNCVHRLTIAPTSVSALSIGEHGATLLTLNHNGDLLLP